MKRCISITIFALALTCCISACAPAAPAQEPAAPSEPTAEITPTPALTPTTVPTPTPTPAPGERFDFKRGRVTCVIDE